MNRTQTKTVKVGNLLLGGNNHVIIQSMTTTPTKNIARTVEQIKELEKMGCQLIRVSVLDLEDAKAIKIIKRQISIPIVADIHFDYKLALEAIHSGVDKIRLNPGNIVDKDKVQLIVEACKEKQIPIRIGVNSGSLPADLPLSAQNMIVAAKRHIEILESLNFYDIVLSLKCSDVLMTIKAYELASKEFNYPLHVGVTEAGTPFTGGIKSGLGIGIILSQNIGNTIRISLTSDPKLEITACKELLRNLNLIENVPNLTSCPTCGRTQYDMIPIAEEIQEFLTTINKNVHVAIMGCIVNGPGEAKEADIGIAGGCGEALLFKRGKVIKKVSQQEIVKILKEEIINF